MVNYKHTVHYYETDKMGIVHHSNYIRWMEEARVYALAEIGFGFDKLEDMGMTSPVVSVNCEYKESTRFAEVIDIKVTVMECRGIRLKLKYEMTNASGRIVCIGVTEHCFIKDNGAFLRIDREYPEFYQALLSICE